ncbi:MAG: hypothetical protein LCH86_25910 [Proteobacteria bacterium]|nr:hypothetical protein [Pseudomonadota bacterium]
MTEKGTVERRHSGEPSTVFQQVVGLGLYCRAKHQIQRAYGRHVSPRGVLDWQITPEAALLAYFENEFREMYELADLAINEDGVVVNTKYETMHFHDFPGGMTESRLQEYYPEARAMHDKWCSVTYGAIRNRETTLFVLCGDISEETIRAIDGHIRRLNPAKQFHILEEPLEGRGGEWMGDDAVWAQHLTPFSIRPSLRSRARYNLHRLRRNLRYFLPALLRPSVITPGRPGVT